MQFLFVKMDTSCILYFKRDDILHLPTSNSFVHYQLPCTPLSFGRCKLCSGDVSHSLDEVNSAELPKGVSCVQVMFNTLLTK